VRIVPVAGKQLEGPETENRGGFASLSRISTGRRNPSFHPSTLHLAIAVFAVPKYLFPPDRLE